MIRAPYSGNRMREARGYLGFTIMEVAGFLGLLTADIRRIEEGKRWLSFDLEARASTLLRRPVSYLRGEPEEPVEVSPELDRLLAETSLSPNDRCELLDFAQFLRHRAGSGPTPPTD